MASDSIMAVFRRFVGNEVASGESHHMGLDAVKLVEGVETRVGHGRDLVLILVVGLGL